LESGNRVPVIAAVPAANLVVVRKRDRPVNISRLVARHRVGEPARHHADDFIRPVVDLEAFANGIGQAGVVLLPVSVTQDGDTVAAVDLIAGRERPSEEWRYSENG